jgi:hypothetical protein
LYTALEDIVANACEDEMARCFEDEPGPCGRLFMVGSASLASSPLQNLLKCIRDFDGNGVLPTSYLDGMDGEHGECIAQNCRVEYMQCHVSMDCFLGTGTNALRQLLDECAASFCTFTAMPTASPTLRPTLAGGNAAIGFIIEADGKQFKMEHKQITAGNLGTIPFDTPLEGEVLVATSCDPSNGGSVELGGMFVIINRGRCNVHDTVRIAFEGGAQLVAFADDAVANSVWIPRDKRLDLPVLSVKYNDASAIQTMMRRGKPVRGRLSSAPYCDTMHAGGIDLALLPPSPSELSCCAVGDIVISFLLYSHDFWNYGVREYPFCLGSEHQCMDPWDVFSEEESEVCGNLCKRNGVCEDGGEGSLGHACGWGGDCQDCGQRNRNDLAAVEGGAYSGVAYGMPTKSEYENAIALMCSDTRWGGGCQSALLEKYTEFHGQDSMYSAILDTVCLESKCALAGGLLGYGVPAQAGADTCFAAQVLVAHLLETEFGVADLSSFSGLCATSLDMETIFGYSCANDMRPALDAKSFEAAKTILCANGGSMNMAMQMLTDLRHEARHGMATFFPLEYLCSGVDAAADVICETTDCRTVYNAELELCDILPFAEYLTVTTTSLANDTTMSCCEASAAMIMEMVRRDNPVTFQHSHCPMGCDVAVQLADTRLTEAKAILRASHACFETTWATAEEIYQEFERGGDVPGGHPSADQFKKFVELDDVCLLQWNLPSAMVKLPGDGCEAADVVLAQHVWHYRPAIAPDVYSAASLDSRSGAIALSSICDHNWGNMLDRALAPQKGLLDNFSFEALCSDPCRCKSDIASAVGCGLHDLEEGGGQLPFCYVAQPGSCAAAFASSEMAGESWTFCSVGHDTCQPYGGGGPCAPFVPEGVSIFVPAGETFESLQSIRDTNDAAAEALGLLGGGNLLHAWLVEAALVSPTCYVTHGQLTCNTRLRRCRSSDGIATPESVCRSDCTKLSGKLAKCSNDVVFNDLLREYDSDVVCASRLVPNGVAGSKDAADGAWLQTVLGISTLLNTDSVAGNASSFGKPVYPTLDGDSRCFSSDTNEHGTDMKKALSLMSCPDRFVKNDGVVSGNTEAQFCVGQCPSVAYTHDDYVVLWLLYTVPGMSALAINIAALFCIVSGKIKHVESSTFLIEQLAVLAGLLGVAPLALFREKLLCSCETELCLRTDAVCGLNALSIHVLMATCFCFVVKFTQLRRSMESMGKKGKSNWALHMSWIVPLVLAIVSVVVQDDGNERFHLARSGVKCQHRYRTLQDEAMLLHIPLSICVLLMTLSVIRVMRLCSRIMVLTHGGYSIGNLLKVVRSRPEMKRLIAVTSFSTFLMVIWLFQAVASRVTFENYFESMDEWMRCIRFDFARHAAVGVEWIDVVREYNDGTQCPASPVGAGLFDSQVLKALFESLTPFMVAATFSRKILQEACRHRHSTTKKKTPKRLTSFKKWMEPSKVDIGAGEDDGTTTHESTTHSQVTSAAETDRRLMNLHGPQDSSENEMRTPEPLSECRSCYA